MSILNAQVVEQSKLVIKSERSRNGLLPPLIFPWANNSKCFVFSRLWKIKKKRANRKTYSEFRIFHVQGSAAVLLITQREALQMNTSKYLANVSGNYGSGIFFKSILLLGNFFLFHNTNSMLTIVNAIELIFKNATMVI